LLDDPWFNDNPEYKHCLDDMRYVRAKEAPSILQMNTILGNALQEIIINGSDIQDTLDAANSEYDAVLNN
jgi:ABC-type glycerol-3-phosphate transport system substrate-binding protein